MARNCPNCSATLKLRPVRGGARTSAARPLWKFEPTRFYCQSCNSELTSRTTPLGFFLIAIALAAPICVDLAVPLGLAASVPPRYAFLLVVLTVSVPLVWVYGRVGLRWSVASPASKS